LNELGSSLGALAQVVVIDLVLAGDNAVVVGMAVAGLPAAQRHRAVLLGIGAATLMRIALASVAVTLLSLVGLTLAGGVLLLWVCWRSYRELRRAHTAGPTIRSVKTMRGAVGQILLADLSMSLDNVLAVAGAARAHPWVLVVGLVLSVVLMGAAANMVARLLERWRWIGWLGLAIVTAVSLRMIWEGSEEVAAGVGWL
jgi:YjbE family integral membrane protein